MVFGGKTKCHPELGSGSFQRGISSKILDKIPKYQMLKQVQHDESYVIASEPERARQSRAAFTLAEVLITLTIIGVIAALTIPNLMQKYTEQATVKKVQKFYSNLSNAYKLAMKDNGIAKEWGLTGTNTASAEKIYKILFEPYFKIAKNCGVSYKGTCIAKVTYKYLNNTNAFNYNDSISAYKVTLNDGSSFWFQAVSQDNHDYDIKIYYDTNGPKRPNQWSIDLFVFDINNDKAIPQGVTAYYGRTYFKKNCKKTTYGYGCTAWVIYKGNMDYLHCDGLDWNKNNCKDK